MKNKKRFVKTALLVTALTLLTFVALAFTASAAVVSSKLNIAYCNLSFENEVHLLYAIESTDADVQLLVWAEPQSDYSYGTQKAALSPYAIMDIEGKEHTVFKYTGLAAKQMTDDVYVRAYHSGDGTYGNVHKYSILQYAYNKLGKTGTATTDIKLITMLNEMLEYGAAAQEYHGYKTDNLATATFVQVQLTAGVLPDASRYGLYRVGQAVNIVALATDGEGGSFSHWADASGNIVANTAAYSLTVGSANATYTPVYVKTSSGLEFESYDDGTCYLSGMGTFTGTELVIPATSPDGDSVVEIDADIAANITTITMPASITTVAKNAFASATSLTDVYYNGSAEQWALIDIASRGNTALENATIHFAVQKTFTVTFVDYNGTVLKTETVQESTSATAPAEPMRQGYTFAGWDKAFDNVTEDITVTATYTIEGHNVIRLVAKNNNDGTVTVTASIEGATVNFAGIEGYVSFDTSLLTYTTHAQLISVSNVNGVINYNETDEKLYFALVRTENITQPSLLFSVTLAYAGNVQTKVNMTVTDIFDQVYATETYEVTGSEINIGG